MLSVMAASGVGIWVGAGSSVVHAHRARRTGIGRSKDMVKTGGENVAALEVENCLVEHVSVSQAAAFGLPHDYWGEELVAAVVLKNGGAVEAEQLRAHCRERLSGFKVPKRIFIVESLPYSSSGKIQKFLMREAVESKLGLKAAKTA